MPLLAKDKQLSLTTNYGKYSAINSLFRSLRTDRAIVILLKIFLDLLTLILHSSKLIQTWPSEKLLDLPSGELFSFMQGYRVDSEVGSIT